MSQIIWAKWLQIHPTPSVRKLQVKEAKKSDENKPSKPIVYTSYLRHGVKTPFKIPEHRQIKCHIV